MIEIRSDDTVEMTITRRNGEVYVILIDLIDLELVSRHHWRIAPNGKTFYAMTNVSRDGKRTTLGLHQVLLGGTGIDHVDGNGLNNRRSNIRFATQAENMHNRASWAKSGYKGVYASGSAWRAMIEADGRTRHLGTFGDILDAARAFDDAARVLHGEFARLNNVDSV